MSASSQTHGSDASGQPFTYDEELKKQWTQYQHIVHIHKTISDNSDRLRSCNFQAVHSRYHTDDNLELVRGVGDSETYWKNVVVEHPVASWKNFERVMISLGDIAPGIAVTESHLYKFVCKQLDNVIEEIKHKEPNDIAPALTNEWPSAEDIEALRIYGDDDMGFGYLPVKIVDKLAEAKLTHLLYEPNTPKGIPDDFWIGVMQVQGNPGEKLLEDDNDDAVDQLLGRDIHEFTETSDWATNKSIADGVGAVDQKYREVIMGIRREFSSKMNDIMAEFTAVKYELAVSKNQVYALKGQLENVEKQIPGDINSSGPTKEEVQDMIMDFFNAFVGSKELYDATAAHVVNYLASEQGKEILHDAATSEDIIKALKVPVLNMVKPEALTYVKSKLQDSSLIQTKPQSKLQLQPETPAPTASWMGLTPLQQNTQDSASSIFGPRGRKRDETSSQTEPEKDKRRKK
ncbi:hypothetical protein F4815DRAFT_500993 [Daldinia loculata]|nr:hypothetical protein F4815DRAFT_500993 [Daldinia loculata]